VASAGSGPASGDSGTGFRPDAGRGGEGSVSDSSRADAGRAESGPDSGRGGDAPATGSGPGSGSDAGRSVAASAAGGGPGSRPDTGRDAGASDSGPTSGSDAPPPGGAFGSRSASGTGERRSGESWASGAAAGDTRPASAWATGASASGSSTERRSSEAGGGPVEQPNGVPTGSAASGSATDAPARDDQATRAPFGGSSAVSGHDLFDPAAHEGASQHGGSAFPLDAEPPEESPDPALARVAASVEDEVLVVDEQPRYHLMGCRALAAQQTIPLPAREAVELGFTPCGWCNPVAGLGARHPASAR
jgi:hypothetical protein